MTTKEVWKFYAEDIRRFILSKAKDPVITEDILQETFIKVHTKLHTLKDKDKLKPWLFSVARYTLLDYFKINKQEFVVEDLEVESEPEPNLHSEQDCLRGIIKSLPKKYRDPLFLSDIKGMKHQDVANQLQLSLPTVKSQIQRARKKIAQGFMDCCGFKMNDEGHLVGEIQDKADCKVCH
ncbi:sigma-70 family RNA polymerase sigma factor [Winogradskyella bathintestinalis]|uniref:Sigma-70 family RNA polymerase sigma factor n=1 Tax=Winogradskyella bathintestinalis TaxID=3035208 RepID=A0ABT7ZUQ1_9FLAO|nr:sigma-70 family RNA polymerase sigma factor [Winogradskyella bathintestinalis]MDN3492700.1 sigma-70 family RNA polymerase sigma factor [Winogradskyella bathintestinalis]